MREVNFSSPHKNQAASIITHALYDRRALDCTSTLPLINSLNHLVYLTTSSARIRQILTQDGGLERLVVMLKRGRCTTPHDSMKWYYALQCIVNIGVRGSDARAQETTGSETIRTRVVEADIVPVIATLLDNYLQGVERLRGIRDQEHQHRKKNRQRPPPPPIDLSLDSNAPQPELRSADPLMLSEDREQPILDDVEDPRQEAISSPPDRTTFPFHQNAQDNHLRDVGMSASNPFTPPHHLRHHSHGHSHSRGEPSSSRRSGNAASLFRPQPFPRQNSDLVPPPMSAGLRHDDGNSSQPDTPATPTGPVRRRTSNTRRSVVEQQRVDDSMSGESDDNETTEIRSPNRSTEDLVVVDGGMDIDGAQPDVATTGDMVEASQGIPDPDDAEGEYSDTFNIRHRSVDGRLIDPTAEPLNPAIPGNEGGGTGDDSFGHMQFPVGLGPPPPLVVIAANLPPLDTVDPPPGVTAPEPVKWMPRAEHIVLSLQLLAYVSKYCHLRSFFLNTHLVPQLRPDALQSRKISDDSEDEDSLDEDEDNEYTLPNDFNLFPLVERFTVKSYSADMKYWACVVMRNLCRKDKTRGDIRQCAYYKCGKWETYARQFAKCRRCRQTKYCSKDCQKSAWVYHRHWCEPAKDSSKEEKQRDAERAARPHQVPLPMPLDMAGEMAAADMLPED